MPTYNQSRYRYIDWIANRILEASELDRLQQITKGVGPDNVTQWAWDLDAVYQDGATFNVTPSISGLTVTLTPTDNTKPMLVFVRGRWEILQTIEAPAVTLSGSTPSLFINWWLTIRDNTVDSSLVDANTGSPTAQMGELVLAVSATDNSGTSLNTSLYFEQNSAPIVLFTFTNTSGTLSLAGVTSVKSQALASEVKGGVVTLTTNTSSGQAVASDDPRLSDARTPGAGTVTDASVRAPVLNGDGSTKPIGTGGGQDPGGISTAKVIHVPTTQTASVVIEAVRTQANSTQSELAAHVGAPLGNGVHVMPTAQQVGATPASHVGQALGLATSHPPTVNADSGGFDVVRTPDASAAPMDPGFGILMANVLQAGLLHNGDVYSKLSNGQIAYPGGKDGDGPQSAKNLGLLSVLATVLAGHVNKTSHNNPHGLTASDLGISTSKANPGWINIGGLIIKFGAASAGGSNVSVNYAGPAYTSFALAFPVPGAGIRDQVYVVSESLSGFTAGTPGSTIAINWFAIGV